MKAQRGHYVKVKPVMLWRHQDAGYDRVESLARKAMSRVWNQLKKETSVAVCKANRKKSSKKIL